jgi:predicted aminopeptidase
LHRVAENVKLEKLRKLWELVKEKLTPEYLKHKLTFAKAYREYTAWQVAALMGNSQYFRIFVNGLQRN